MLNRKDVNEINKSRSGLMGIAIIWIVFFHSGLVFPGSVFPFLKEIGYGGVDIFLFLSGMGIYYSLDKNSNEVFFYKKRILRILPSYLPVLIAYSLLVFFTDSFGLEGLVKFFQAFFGNIAFVGAFIGLEYQFNWYVQAIMIFYLCSPLIYKILNSGTVGKILLCLFVFALQVVAFGNNNLHMATSRMFIYIAGMFVAQTSGNDSGKSKTWMVYFAAGLGVVLLIAAFVFFDKYLWFGLYWYPFFLITPGLCLCMSKLLMSVNRLKIGECFLWPINILGKCSFGIYLIHILIFYFVERLHFQMTQGWWWLYIVISLVLGVLYDIGFNFVFKKIIERRKAKALVKNSQENLGE